MIFLAKNFTPKASLKENNKSYIPFYVITDYSLSAGKCFSASVRTNPNDSWITRSFSAVDSTVWENSCPKWGNRADSCTRRRRFALGRREPCLCLLAHLIQPCLLTCTQTPWCLFIKAQFTLEVHLLPHRPYANWQSAISWSSFKTRHLKFLERNSYINRVVCLERGQRRGPSRVTHTDLSACYCY